jgi:hypothetical protein
MNQLTEKLNELRTAQQERLGTSPIVCPRCKQQVSLAASCSNCSKPLLQGRLLSRILLILVPFIFLTGIIGTFTTANFLITFLKIGPIAMFVVIIALATMRDVTSMMGGLPSAIFLPASAREKYLRLANRIAADKAIPNEVKARMFGFVLCQPYVKLSEWHMVSNRDSCGISFLQENQNATDITPETRDVLNDLVFIEIMQESLASGWVYDSYVDCAVLTARDTDVLLQAAEIIQKERGDYGQTLLNKVVPKITEKAPKVARILG